MIARKALLLMFFCISIPAGQSSSKQRPTADATAAAPTPASPGATQGTATCSLSIVGFGGQREGIKSASLACIGGTITVGAHKVLSDFWGPKRKTMPGVVWDDDHCIERTDCLLTICGRSNAVFNSASITALRGGGTPTWRMAVSVSQQSSVTFRQSSFALIKEATPLVVDDVGTSVLLDHCTIHGNVLTTMHEDYAWTSGVLASAANLTIVSSTIARNTAVGAAAGAITATLASHVDIQDTVFSLNVGENGAALYADEQSRVVIRDSHFKDNSASQEGGAVYACGQAEVSIESGKRSAGTSMVTMVQF
jgi:hypothetical protein